ncbi:MAG: hypothetical protein M3Q83_04400 [Pseudomonadota bacterium]|nr:hypothetical protein [Pseudomonadota bacterium]
MILLALSAATIVLIAFVHSWLGERRLIGPILVLDSPVTQSSLGRGVIRFAGHLTSLLMLVTALMIVWPTTPSPLVRITGAAYLGAGLVDAVMTRGRHIGWPMLAGAGLLALLGDWTRG